MMGQDRSPQLYAIIASPPQRIHVDKMKASMFSLLDCLPAGDPRARRFPAQCLHFTSQSI